MTWYNDPEPTGGPPPFEAQPSGMPTNSLPLPPPAGVGGDLPTSSPNGPNKNVWWIVAGVGTLLAMMTVGTGAFLLLSNRTEELSMGDYAEKLCDEVIQPGLDDIEGVADDDEFEDLADLEELTSESDARDFLRFMTLTTDQAEKMVDNIDSFNQGHRLRGADGEDLQEDLTDYTDDGRDAIEQLRRFITNADPADAEDLMEEFIDLDVSSSSLSDTEVGAEVNEELADVDDACSLN
jgi:hypothetical protein